MSKNTKKKKDETKVLDSDFAIYIDFNKETGSPSRVFKTADQLITSFQKFDKLLCKGIDNKIVPIMFLQEIEAGSLKIWLKNTLECLDDQAMHDGDWKKVVGRFLLNAKYATIRWINNSEEVDDEKSLVELSNEIRKFAKNTDVKYIPDYYPPTLKELSDSIRDITLAKSSLVQSDKLEIISDKQKISMRLDITWTDDEFDKILTKETIKNPSIKMILGVKKPDYIGESQWELKHGTQTVNAKIEDIGWLKKFQNKDIDVRPGDSLVCVVSHELNYGYNNELINEKFIIEKIVEVLEDDLKKQGKLFPPSKK